MPDGKAIVSRAYVVRRDGGGVVRIRDLSSRALKPEIPAQSTRCIALSPDGRMVAGTGSERSPDGRAVDGLVRLWDTRTGELRHTWTVVGEGRTGLGPVAFSPDGRLVAVGSEVGERVRERRAGEIHLWDVESERLVWSQACHDDDVTGLVFTPDSKLLVSGGRDRVVKLWEVVEPMNPVVDWTAS
jgi:WD40 repeat protein